MTIRTFLTAIAVSTLICFLAWIAVGIFIDPDLAGLAGFALFYFSLFLWVCGILILAGFYARYFSNPNALPYPLLAISVRQALILSAALDAFLVLKGAHILNWINGIFLAVAAIFIESYFLSASYEHSRGDRKN